MAEDAEDLTMKPRLPIPALAIVVAATMPALGIGMKGTLPWAGKLKKEMAYFANLTSKTSESTSVGPKSQRPVMNAVIMGRKTWESIPTKFRPLKGRLNIVLGRSVSSELQESLSKGRASKPVDGSGRAIEGPVHAKGWEQAIDILQRLRQPGGHPGESSGADEVVLPEIRVDRSFVIGGAEIYRQALEMGFVNRVYCTMIESDFECDTFFPLKLNEGQAAPPMEVGETERGPGELLEPLTNGIDAGWGSHEWEKDDERNKEQQEGDIRYHYTMFRPINL